MSLREGSLVAGRFLVGGLAGKGGMGEVFRAHDIRTGEPVALKVLHTRGDAPVATERFLREARLLCELNHPGIASYVAHGQLENGRPYLAIGWLTGQDLSERLARGPLRVSECVTLLERVADALAFAHGRGVVHRDIKPGNLFLRDDRVDRVTLLDFGIAQAELADTTLTRTGRIIGTPGYMAPEQARGDRDIGPSADVFSLGCVLFECLTGRPPFLARDPVAVITKSRFDDAPPVETLRPETPPALSALLARMFDKDPARRPSDAAALRDELAALDLHAQDSAPARSGNIAAHAPEALGGDVMQLFCVVLAVPGVAPRFAELETLPATGPEARPPRDALRSRLMRLKGRIQWLADGSLAVIVPPAPSAVDQAAQGARCALAIKEQWPEARVVLATGRALLKDRLPVGEALDRAKALLVPGGSAASRGSDPEIEGAPEAGVGVWIDPLTERLLGSRFELTTAGEHAVVRGELAGGADAPRLLLGRPIPCVGRDQELSMLTAAIARCAEDAEASGALVIAPPGAGKSRLRHEVLRRLRDQAVALEVFSGDGGASTGAAAGAPYGLLADALRRGCGVQAGDPPELQEEKIRRRAGARLAPVHAARVGELLASLCGVPVAEPSDLLGAARSDPGIMSEQVQRAFLDFLGAECAARPCLLVLDDLHCSDDATVQLLDAALRELRGLPLFVLAFARPEVTARFPALWEASRTVQRIHLPGLSNRAAERLVAAALGAEVPAAVAARIVEQAAGNPLLLEELLRAAAEGEEQPEAVLAMLQARLSCLGPEVRRLLCAASVLGRTFSARAAIALLGQEQDTQQTKCALADLVRLEIIESQWSGRAPGEVEYRFCHALVRDAALRLLTDEDRALGEELAARHRAGEPAPLAEHG
ncbi:protein kinase [Sorangium cellulosum]|uniref:Protein kinase n=1 Tax=Sorangium cellulosum TaxID=56 RepID=A0A2L0EPS0_SORCE|nr:serine/threonine-protein kinase [Sorangium cellulosum]AUX41262.1 protein kinase [Sorangium cellulosum]